jgi:hypothetical protein
MPVPDLYIADESGDETEADVTDFAATTEFSQGRIGPGTYWHR